MPLLLTVSMLTTAYGGWPFDLVLLLLPVQAATMAARRAECDFDDGNRLVCGAECNALYATGSSGRILLVHLDHAGGSGLLCVGWRGLSSFPRSAWERTLDALRPVFSVSV